MYAKYVGYNHKASQSFHVCNYWPIIGVYLTLFRKPHFNVSLS